MIWQHFESQAPDLASRGTALLHRQIAYLATLQRDGAPRLHPVRPVLGAGHLFVFIDRASPKRKDLQHDGRYALHCAVFEGNGLSAEFLLMGSASEDNSRVLREKAERAWGGAVPEKYSLFTFSVEKALLTTYSEDRQPVRQRWSAP
jgi:hypothetical protein